MRPSGLRAWGFETPACLCTLTDPRVTHRTHYLKSPGLRIQALAQASCEMLAGIDCGVA